MGRPELVVLTDIKGNPTGSALKATVHSADTPLHLAFSCYLMNADEELLVTRRALAKKSWPGVWTNSFCGHPGPDEPMQLALQRRGKEELGVVVSSVQLALQDFTYRAVDPGGVVENEICPVFVARLDGEVRPNHDEVVEWAWVKPERLVTAVEAAPFAFSPWLRLQLPELIKAGWLQ